MRDSFASSTEGVSSSGDEQGIGTARVRVLLFSVLREQIGMGELEVGLPDPPTGAALLDRLETAHPVLAPYRSVVRLAVNQRYVQPRAILEAGDEVALITPVSGG